MNKFETYPKQEEVSSNPPKGSSLETRDSNHKKKCGLGAFYKPGSRPSESLDEMNPKNKKKNQSDEESSSDDSFGSGDSSEESKDSESQNESSEDDQTPPNQLDLLKKMMEKLDTRRVPELDDFDEDGCLSLKKYIQKFERYCKANIKGGKSYWIKELEKKLSGQTLKAIQAIQDKKQNYTTIKNKLIEYEKEMLQMKKTRAREQFAKMQYDSNNSLYLYSTSLERKFRVAYPNHNPS